MTITMKVGDIQIQCENACSLIHMCSQLVYLDSSLSIMEKEHAINKLNHAQCYIMLEQFNIGE